MSDWFHDCIKFTLNSYKFSLIIFNWTEPFPIEMPRKTVCVCVAVIKWFVVVFRIFSKCFINHIIWSLDRRNWKTSKIPYPYLFFFLSPCLSISLFNHFYFSYEFLSPPFSWFYSLNPIILVIMFKELFINFARIFFGQITKRKHPNGSTLGRVSIVHEKLRVISVIRSTAKKKHIQSSL